MTMTPFCIHNGIPALVQQGLYHIYIYIYKRVLGGFFVYKTNIVIWSIPFTKPLCRPVKSEYVSYIQQGIHWAAIYGALLLAPYRCWVSATHLKKER